MKPPIQPSSGLVVPTNELIRKLRQVYSTHCGLCIFAPDNKSVAVNKQLNIAIPGCGDCLSVPLGRTPMDHLVRFLAGNYTSVGTGEAEKIIGVFSHFPESVVLVTGPGVSATGEVPCIGIVRGPEATLLQSKSHSFLTFSEKELGLFRLQYKDEELQVAFGFDLSINGLILKGSSVPASMLLRPAWEAIFDILAKNPAELFRFSQDFRAFEEFLAETYERDGWDVALTPRSGDKGRDVIAVRADFGGIKILEQAKAYKRGHLVTAKDVRELHSVLTRDQSASKAILTTTSDFAPGARDDYADLSPTRLELRNGFDLIQWVKSVAGK